jgi:hypothetical protein
MPEMGTSGLMSGDGKRGGARRQYPRPSSTLPAAASARALPAPDTDVPPLLKAALPKRTESRGPGPSRRRGPSRQDLRLGTAPREQRSRDAPGQPRDVPRVYVLQVLDAADSSFCYSTHRSKPGITRIGMTNLAAIRPKSCVNRPTHAVRETRQARAWFRFLGI